MGISRERSGELFSFSQSILWSLFPIITVLTLSTLPPLHSLAISTFFSTIFFAIILTYQKKWSELKCNVWKEMLLSGLFIGILFYALFFIGIQFTSAGNAGIVSLMHIFFSFIILGLWKKEKIIPKQVLGASLMMFGAITILFRGSFIPNIGDLLILMGTIMLPFGNYFQQQARKKVSATFLMFVRSIVTFLFISILALIFEPNISVEELKTSLPFLLINGILLLGLSKIFWIEAIHRISISKAASLTTIDPVFTLIFSFFILGDIPTIWQIVALIPMIIGVLLILEKKSNRQN